MAGYLIAETTREEREKIVAESLGNIERNIKRIPKKVGVKVM